MLHINLEREQKTLKKYRETPLAAIVSYNDSKEETHTTDRREIKTLQIKQQRTRAPVDNKQMSTAMTHSNGSHNEEISITRQRNFSDSVSRSNL